MAEMQCNTDGAVKLPAVLDSAAAAGLLVLLRKSLAAERALRLDASAIETVTLPCLQIILSALKSTDRIVIETPSDALLGALRDVGFAWENKPNNHDDAPNDDREVAAQNEVRQEPDRNPTPANGPADGSAMCKRILTIDDSKTMRDMLLLALTDAGFEVLQAVDGQDGLTMLDREKVDVVITDINMPKMNGYEVIEHMRANPGHRDTPILVLTTESDQQNKERARQAGANGWIVKPFDPDKLAAVIRQISP